MIVKPLVNAIVNMGESPIPLTPFIMPTPSVTRSVSATPTPTVSVTPTLTPGVSVSPTRTPTRTPAATVTGTPAVTPTRTPSATAALPTVSATPSISVTPTPSKIHPQLNVSGVPLTGKVGTPYNGTLVTTGGNGTYTYSVWLNILPHGLNLHTTDGTITGNPSTAGTYEVGLQVDSGGDTDQEIITIVIEE